MAEKHLEGAIMKAKKLAGALVLAPVLLFAACAAQPSVPISANWYSSTNNYGGLTGTSEQLSYTVTFTPKDSGGDVRAELDAGTYTTNLLAVNIPYAEGKPVGYYLETKYTITGRYYFKNESCGDFTDSITAKVWFLGVSDGLRPVRSEREVTSNLPRTAAAKKEDVTVKYHYQYVASYDAALTTSTVTLTYPERVGTEGYEPSVTTLNVGGGGSFFDNEQILFVLRGIDPSAAFSFRTVNPSKLAVATLASSGTPTLEKYGCTFALNGEEAKRDIESYRVSIGYGGSNPGNTQELVYARCVDPNANEFRNVLLHMESSMIYDLGTYNFDLKEATFNIEK